MFNNHANYSIVVNGVDRVVYGKSLNSLLAKGHSLQTVQNFRPIQLGGSALSGGADDASTVAADDAATAATDTTAAKVAAYRGYVTAYTNKYGQLPDGDIVISITGLHRDNLWKARTKDQMSFVPDGELLVVDGRNIAVVAATQQEEGDLESKNFDASGDLARLLTAAENAKLPTTTAYTVASVGSTSTQIIFNQNSSSADVAAGTDTPCDATLIQLKALLESVPNEEGRTLVIIGSAGYAMSKDSGMCFANTLGLLSNSIYDNMVDRVVGGTGDNVKAQLFILRLTRLHRVGGYKFVLAIVPRGVPEMPQGGSHSKQRILDAFNSVPSRRIVVIEVSGKQTKIFESSLSVVGDKPTTDADFCASINERKVPDLKDKEKTYGSGELFESVRPMPTPTPLPPPSDLAFLLAESVQRPAATKTGATLEVKGIGGVKTTYWVPVSVPVGSSVYITVAGNRATIVKNKKYTVSANP